MADAAERSANRFALLMLDDAGLDQGLISEGRQLLGTAELAATVRTFRELDVSNGGALTPDQVVAAMQAVKPMATREQVLKLIATFDQNGDGEIQLDEFVVMMGRLFAVTYDATTSASGGGVAPKVSSKQRKASANFIDSLSKMSNSVDPAALKEEGVDFISTYINIGGLDLKPAIGSLDGYSVHVIGYIIEVDAVAKSGDKPKGGRAAYKPATVGLMHDQSLSPPKRNSPPSTDEEKKPVITTKKAVFAEGSTLIWNSTVRAEIPFATPGTLRLDLYVTPSGKVEGPDSSEQYFSSVKVATASLDLGEISKSDWLEEMRAVNLQRLLLPEFIMQEQSLRAASENHDSTQLDVSPEKAPPLQRKNSLNNFAEEDEDEEASVINLNRHKDSGFTRLSKRITTRSIIRRQSTFGSGLHQKIPKECGLLIGVVKDPKAVALIEAMWDTRRLGNSRSVRLMERPWYIIPPNDKRVQKWELIILGAMIFVSTVTPFEVSVMGSTKDFSVLWFLNWGIDGIFVLDLILQFFLGYFDRALNRVINDPHFIIIRYLKSWYVGLRVVERNDGVPYLIRERACVPITGSSPILSRSFHSRCFSRTTLSWESCAWCVLYGWSSLSS